MAVAIWVTVIAMPALHPVATAEPALKPNQPTHSSEARIKVRTTLCGRTGPVLLRLPSISAHIKAGNAGIDMHDGAAGKVEHVQALSFPARGNRPSDTDGRSGQVDQNRPQADEPQHRREFHPLGESAGDERGVMIANVIWKQA